jgi:hypothetical protein
MYSSLQQLFLPKYAPTYAFPFKVSLGLGVFAWLSYAGYRILLVRVNAWRRKKVASMTPEEIHIENTTDTRLGDKKWTFQYTT